MTTGRNDAQPNFEGDQAIETLQPTVRGRPRKVAAERDGDTLSPTAEDAGPCDGRVGMTQGVLLGVGGVYVTTGSVLVTCIAAVCALASAYLDTCGTSRRRRR